jgi:hypothetical protein
MNKNEIAIGLGVVGALAAGTALTIEVIKKNNTIEARLKRIDKKINRELRKPLKLYRKSKEEPATDSAAPAEQNDEAATIEPKHILKNTMNKIFKS